MRVIILISSLALLAGCYSDMNKAHSEYQCKDKGGVYRYGNEFFKIQCNNGESIDYGRATPLPEGWRVGEK